MPAAARAARKTASPDANPPLLLTLEEAAARLRIHRSTLYALLREGRGPRTVRINSRLLFRPADIEAFVERCAA